MGQAEIVSQTPCSSLTVRLIGPDTPTSLRAQAFEITQNLLAEAQPSDVARTVDLLGGSDFLDILARSSREGTDVDIRVPVSLAPIIPGSHQ